MGGDPLITMAIWALGVFAVLATTWIQDRRERRRIEDIRDGLEDQMRTLRSHVDEKHQIVVEMLETMMEKKGASSNGTDDNSED